MGMGQAVDIGQLLSEYISQLEKAAPLGVATLDSNAKIPKVQIDLDAVDVGAIATETDPTVASFTKGLTSNNTILTALNAATGTISASILPSYVDDVLNFANLAAFPITGETGKIYVTENDNKTYRWTGTVYVEISSAGTATEALKLTTPRTISTTGDATFSVSFDGSANVSGAITLANAAGIGGAVGSATHSPAIQYNTKGLITGAIQQTITPAWSNVTSKPTTLAGYGITNALALTGGALTGALTSSSTFSTSNTTPSTSPTSGANVIAGGQGIGGSQHIQGFSSLGGVASDHPAIKIKEILGTSAATQGGIAVIPHGITGVGTTHRIIGVLVGIIHSGQGFVSNGHSGGYWYHYSWDETSILITNHPSDSINILSKSVVATIVYRVI